MRSVLLLSVIVLFSAVQASAEQSLPVWNQAINVQAGQYAYQMVNVASPLVNGRIAGSFQATGGANNDISFYVLNADEFKTFVGRAPHTSLYSADKKRSGVVSVPIRDAGTYYLVFDNSFSILSTKQIRSDFRLVYEGIDQERADQLAKLQNDRVKRVGDILGKLTEAIQARERAMGTRQINPPIQFALIADKTINAFAIPERNLIAVNIGLIEFAESAGTPELTDAILAGVLGHELSHVFYRHKSGNIQGQQSEAVGTGAAAAFLINPLVGLFAGALVFDHGKSYDRAEEQEADMLGIQLACSAGYDPTGLLILMQRLARDTGGSEFLSTHPSPQNRLDYLQSAAVSCLKPQPEPTKPSTRVSQPTVLYQPTPTYTTEAKRAGIRGTVSIALIVGTDGKAHDLRIVKGLGYGLDESVIQTVETLWRFTPGQLDGQPVSVSITVNVNFQP